MISSGFTISHEIAPFIVIFLQLMTNFWNEKIKKTWDFGIKRTHFWDLVTRAQNMSMNPLKKISRQRQTKKRLRNILKLQSDKIYSYTKKPFGPLQLDKFGVLVNFITQKFCILAQHFLCQFLWWELLYEKNATKYVVYVKILT